MILLALPSGLLGQTAPPPVSSEVTSNDLPPSAVLNETLAPFERTRADLANWSDVEMASFHATTERAKAECHRLEQNPHEGEEALALARLCALGMEWDSTYSAARWYTRKSAPAGEAQHLPMGFALLLQADLNLQATTRAVEELRELKSRLPYTSEVDAIFSYTISATEIMQPERALDAARLCWQDQLAVVSGTQTDAPRLSPGTATEEAWNTLGLFHVAGLTEEEGNAKTELLKAVASYAQPHTAVDDYAAQRGQARYEWLGKTFPTVPMERSTYPVVAKKPVAASQMMLHVIEQEDAADVTALAHAVDSLRSHLPVGTDAQLVITPSSSPSAAERPEKRESIHARWTKNDLPSQFDFNGGPLFVVTDARQRILYLGQGTAAWLNPQQQAEVLLDHLQKSK